MTNIQKQENRAVSPVNQMKNLLANQGMQNLFADALNENKDRFLASIIDLSLIHISEPTRQVR